MKVSKRDILLLVGFLGILAAVCSYVFVFQPTTEKNEALAQENKQLENRIADLQNKSENRDTYESETARMRREMEEIYQLFRWMCARKTRSFWRSIRNCFLRWRWSPSR